MSINALQTKSYAGDGITLYQCLNCYEDFALFSDPVSEGWQYCPVCGTKWKEIRPAVYKPFSGGHTLLARQHEEGLLAGTPDIQLRYVNDKYTGEWHYKYGHSKYNMYTIPKDVPTGMRRLHIIMQYLYNSIRDHFLEKQDDLDLEFQTEWRLILKLKSGTRYIPIPQNRVDEIKTKISSQA